ncbi:MAG: hypothetical protein CM15mP77_4520 [Synechococcus sp.]|nr:MAG: hypothetical protein CM15mP77_4520 [Synechococcus sp.]
MKHSWVVRDPADLGRSSLRRFDRRQRPARSVLIDIPKDVGQERFNYVPVEPGSVIPGGFHQPEPRSMLLWRRRSI